MVKLNILNMENFFDTVNACIGKVYMLCPNGKKQTLMEKKDTGQFLAGNTSKTKKRSFILEIPNPTTI